MPVSVSAGHHRGEDDDPASREPPVDPWGDRGQTVPALTSLGNRLEAAGRGRHHPGVQFSFDLPFLEGRLVRLEPLSERHCDDLRWAGEEDRTSYGFTTVPRPAGGDG